MSITRRFTLIAAALLALFAAAPLRAEIKTQTVEYKDGDTVLEGLAVYDDAATGNMPGVLIAHQWMGITDHERHAAKELAHLGYVAFVADIYGKDQRPADRKGAGEMAGKFKGGDRADLRRRMSLALAELRKQPHVDTAKIAAIGYCFGGTAVLELARSGADVTGVVSFHGGLAAGTADGAGNIKAKLLVCHGAVDPFVKPEEVDAFKKEMGDAKVTMQFFAYKDAVHAFTQPEAGNDPSKGAAYNKDAAMQSWDQMKTFFGEIFAAK